MIMNKLKNTILDWLVMTWPLDQISRMGGKISRRQLRKLWADMGVTLDEHMDVVSDAGAKPPLDQTDKI